MIVWIVTKLACLMYGVEMAPGVKVLFTCLSWVEMFLVITWVVLSFFAWLSERVSK